MVAATRIGIIGDFNPANATHRATNDCIVHAARALNKPFESIWLPTDKQHDYCQFNGLFCSPGSPYRSLEGALSGIRFARTNGIPFLGTCGGFQHMILEFARNVLGIEDADHAETNPYASKLFIVPLTCSLVGKTMTVHIQPGTKAASAYQTAEHPGPSCACFLEAQRARMRATAREETLRSSSGGRSTPGPSCACFLEAQRARMRATAREETLRSSSGGRSTPGPSCACFLEAQRARMRATAREETLRSSSGGRSTPGPSCACFLEAQRARMRATAREETLRSSSGGRSTPGPSCACFLEDYYCNFGLNPAYRDELVKAGLVISGLDQDGETRIMELPSHPFFIGTLFVPQAKSLPHSPHKITLAFCRQASATNIP